MTLEETWAVEALMTANASPEVRDLLAEWRVWIDKIGNADRILRDLEGLKRPGDKFDEDALKEQGALPKYREKLTEADKAIRDQIRRELGTVQLVTTNELGE
jgi:hypothetical protein